jgi:hypothetical protein
MAEHQLLISGVHYGANGDSVAGHTETEEERLCTLELLSRIDSVRPVVVLSPDPSNHIHRNAIQARALGKRIGRVSYDDNERAWKLLRQTGKPMLLARVKDVSIEDHGYVNVIVEAEELQESLQPSALEIEWRLWLTDLPLLPESEQLQAQQEVAYVLDNVYLPHLAEADFKEVKTYLDIWLENSWHDLSREARQKRSEYIELLLASPNKEMRQLAEPLKEQRRRLLEREPLDRLATVWWDARLESAEVKYLWQQWRLKNENKLWLGLRRIDTLLRQLPGELYGDIGKLDVILSCLYYLNTPRKAFQSIMALLMLRDLTCRELGIAMHPMTEDEYEADGRITNPMEMPTTIGRVVAFAETQCDKAQKQTIQLLAQWLRDDYEQSHPKEIEALAETDPLVVISGDVNGDVIERGGTKNENRKE